MGEMASNGFRGKLEQMLGHQVCAYTGYELGHAGRLEEVDDDYVTIVFTGEVSPDVPWQPGDDEPVVTTIPIGHLMAIEQVCCTRSGGSHRSPGSPPGPLLGSGPY